LFSDKKSIKSKFSTCGQLRKILLMVIIIFSLSLIILPQSALAHNPGNMNLDYNFTAQKLNVTITHNVVDPNNHYIENVQIWKNNNLIVDQDYTSQPSTSSFTYSFDISASDGDVIKVTATCSISGDITDQLTVEGPQTPNISLSVNPNITTIDENDTQDFLVTITANSEPLEGYSPTISANLGTISDGKVKSNGRFEFDYTASEVAKNEAETITILVTKDGYNDGSLSLQFTISNTAVEPNQKLTLDGIISNNEYEFTAEFSNGDFKVHWTLSGDSITFGLEAKTTGWVSIGFGSSVMSGADMVIGWVDSQGSVTVIDSYTQEGSRQHPADTNQGGTDDILEFGGSENNGWTRIEFKRLLATGDNKDQNIPNDGKIEIIWATGNGDNFNDQHNQRGAGTINLATGEAEEDDIPVLWPFHAILMVLGFIFMLKAIIIAHFLRKENWWLKAHKTINSLAVIFALLGLSMAVYMVTEAETGHFRVPHAFLGIVTIIFVIISPSLGFAQFKAGGKKSIKTAHKIFGYLTLILMLIMIVSGLIQAGVL
jgi:hypothetical protein